MFVQTALTRFALILALGAGSLYAADGIRIDDPLTIQKCGGCHQRDSNGIMTRLSYIRTSPEVWEQAIKRMIRLNGLSATPAEVRNIVHYLSWNNGLAPEEAAIGFWEVEHRTEGYQDDRVPNPALQKTCNNCHSLGRVLAQRRSKEDYEKLIAMHIGLFPGAENVYRPQHPKPTPAEYEQVRLTSTTAGQVVVEPRGGGASALANPKAPVDIALDYLSSAQPLITPEWTRWQAAMRNPKLGGTWLLTGYEPGRGKIYGQLVVTPGAAEDQFSTSVEFTYATSGLALKLAGKSVIYTGYSWRGRASTGAESGAVGPIPSTWREALLVSRDGNHMDGRFFWSAFGELGIDVHLIRVGAEPVVVGTDVSALQSPSRREIKIYGANLPASLKPTDITLGPGLTISKVVNVTPTVATVEVETAANLPVGLRDLTVASATSVGALAVYNKVDYIMVTPNARISRLGGIKYPKEFAQYEVTAYAAGPDGKAHTADDIPLGPVAAEWSLEEFYSTPDDDDIKFVGKVDDSGLFTPNVEGPNPARKKQANNFGVNNYGDVWVAATYKAANQTPLKAKAYLVVTVPNYTLYDQPEVAQ